jgi:hypothetical protein
MMNRLAGALLLLLSLTTASAQSKSWRGTWSATIAGGGRVFGGTWDATLGDDPDTVLGNWSAIDQAGETVATGTWAARKESKIWRGSWQARLASGQVFSGTWRSQSQLPATAHLADLLEAASAKTAGGTWRMGAASGAWSIQTDPRP